MGIDAGALRLSDTARVVVVGPSGSGKSTLARGLAARFGLRHVELDAIYHQADWTGLPAEEFRARVAQVTAAPGWVVDGNYRVALDLALVYAEVVVWLDLPRRVVLPRLIARSWRRVLRREVLWNGNRERWPSLIDPRPTHNVVLWSATTAGILRRYLRRVLSERGDLDVVRLRSPRAVAELLGALRG